MSNVRFVIRNEDAVWIGVLVNPALRAWHSNDAESRAITAGTITGKAMGWAREEVRP
jgi:hypothetical protein